jgi:predicted hydrocarbon binding protein
MVERKVRGSVINGYLRYVEKNWGKEGVARCRAETKLTGIDIKDGLQYPNAILLAVIKWLSVNYGMAHIRKAGNHAVKNLGLLSYIVRFSSIEAMLRRAKNAYHEAYGFGEVGMQISKNSAIATMKDVSEIPENCEGWIGALEALLEITGTKGAVVKTKCQLKGDPSCQYEIKWQ